MGGCRNRKCKRAAIGFNPALAGVAESVAISLKASVDYSENDGIKVIGGKHIGSEGKYDKSASSVIYDGTVDFVGGKVGGFFGKKISKVAEASVSKAIKQETKVVKQLVKATNKVNKITNGGRNTGSKALIAKETFQKAKAVADAARGNTVRAQTKKAVVNGPLGTMTNGALRNVATDKAKKAIDIK